MSISGLASLLKNFSMGLRCLLQAWPLFLKTWVCDVCFEPGLSS